VSKHILVSDVAQEATFRYQYPGDPKDLGTTLSAAKYVQDVEEDPVIIINGLTKGWR
jgi:hypothetical protein